jgi:hypothetical protein
MMVEPKFVTRMRAAAFWTASGVLSVLLAQSFIVGPLPEAAAFTLASVFASYAFPAAVFALLRLVQAFEYISDPYTELWAVVSTETFTKSVPRA